MMTNLRGNRLLPISLLDVAAPVPNLWVEHLTRSQCCSWCARGNSAFRRAGLPLLRTQIQVVCFAHTHPPGWEGGAGAPAPRDVVLLSRRLFRDLPPDLQYADHTLVDDGR